MNHRNYTSAHWVTFIFIHLELEAVSLEKQLRIKKDQLKKKEKNANCSRISYILRTSLWHFHDISRYLTSHVPACIWTKVPQWNHTPQPAKLRVRQNWREKSENGQKLGHVERKQQFSFRLGGKLLSQHAPQFQRSNFKLNQPTNAAKKRRGAL